MLLATHALAYGSAAAQGGRVAVAIGGQTTGVVAPAASQPESAAAGTAALVQSASPAATPGARPRIGLVLSGGGARGAAHIGVLRVLEQLRIPVDAIAGTSMGAVVGGLYASGLSARDVEGIMTSINWQDAFRDRPPRQDLNLRRKEEDETFLVKFPLGLRGGRVALPRGLIQGQKLTQILRRLTLPVAQLQDFDELPTPFRAVATDLESGDPVILKSGDLTTAMRASLSAPGVFSPVERDGHLLVDGGIADNVPVDIARAMGVDLVIVVDVGAPLQGRRQLDSAPAISNQMLAILIRQNSQRQLATLGPRDILIRPALGNASSFDFGGVARVIAAGAAAARAMAPRLSALSVSDADMQRYALRREAGRSPPSRIDFVAAAPGSNSRGQAVAGQFQDMVGHALDARQLDRRVTTLYARGGLDTLDYRPVGEPARYGLQIDAHPSAVGPNYMRFGLSLQDDFQGNSTYDAAVRFVMSDLTRNSGEWVTDLQIGNVTRVASEVFMPLAAFSPWFAMPHAADTSRDVDIVLDQSLLAVYREHLFTYGVDFGRQFGNWGEVRVGVQREQGHYRLRVGDPDDSRLNRPAYGPFDTRDFFVRLTYDRLDDVNFPHRGQQAVVQWIARRSVSGIQQPTDQVTANYVAAHTFGRDTLVFSASSGATLQANVTDINLLFPLGGFLNLSGLRADSLNGPDFGIARALYYRQIGRGGPGYFDLPTYIGLSLEAGNVWQNRVDARFSNLRKDASIFLGLDTLLGPVYLASGFDQHGDQAFYLFLGRSF
ncbi:MAG: patatin-like phospholipase family protein [Proteobacteria bacterium]|nr:patatin-like phospholipase family protein [Pseudomonadota bacterium]